MTIQSTTVLKVLEVGKRYAKFNTPFSRFLNWIGFQLRPSHEYWANQGISFEVKAGQAIAIIGQNGAGKSTLLKMITGTVRPTTGSIELNGKVSAMLELGLGFNQEFTGRQNAYMSGGLMGLSTAQLDALLPEIEDFAEIGDYFDQPLRVYSSGMQARLAFAVATAVRPDILIVDEILSVGDSYFQHRSFDRIRQFKKQGTAIIMVTHSISDVRSMCEQVVLLDKGKVLKNGPADEVVDYYNAMIAEKENLKFSIEQSRNDRGWVHTRSGDGTVEVHQLILQNRDSGTAVATARVGEPLLLECEIKVNHDIDKLVLGIMLRDKQGTVVWGSNTWHTGQVQAALKAGDRLIYRIPFDCTLGPGSYSVTTALTNDQTHLERNYEWSDNSLVFDVVNFDKHVFVGCSWLNATFDIEKISGPKSD